MPRLPVPTLHLLAHTFRKEGKIRNMKISNFFSIKTLNFSHSDDVVCRRSVGLAYPTGPLYVDYI